MNYESGGATVAGISLPSHSKMPLPMKTRNLLIAAMIGAGILALSWIIGSRKESETKPSEIIPARIEPSPGPISAPSVSPHAIMEDDPGPALTPTLDLQKGILPWEVRVNRITGAPGISEDAKGAALLQMLFTLPEEGVESAAREAIARITDGNYKAALALVLNPQTPASALSVLFADLLERPDSIALPTLLFIARTPTHPFAESARDDLALLLGTQFGTDWAKWDAAIREYLKE